MLFLQNSRKIFYPFKIFNLGTKLYHLTFNMRIENSSHQNEKKYYLINNNTILSTPLTGLRAYQNRIDGSTDPTWCKEEPQDLQHWLTRCPATAAQRWLLLREHSGNLDCLTRYQRCHSAGTHRCGRTGKSLHRSDSLMDGTFQKTVRC